MNIYIDFDDVICETAKKIRDIAEELFGIDLPYREIQFFNLKKTFDLDDEKYEMLMEHAHFPETLLAYEETPGASETINKWINSGHNVKIITGRPFNSYEPSREWLDRHMLTAAPLFCVDKYGREKESGGFAFNMTLAELYKMHFDFAVEDSPNAFEHVLHFDNCKVAVFNRPWNVNTELPNSNFTRCEGWKEIDSLVDKNSGRFS